MDGFSRILIFEYFSKIYQEDPNQLNFDKSNEYFNEDQYTFLSYLAQLFLERKMFQTNFVQKIKTHFVLSNFFYWGGGIVPFMNKIMWKNTVERGRPRMTI